MDHLCYLCLVFVLLSRLFVAALWSPAWKGLTSWLLFVMSNCDFVTFSMWYPGSSVVLDCIDSDLCRPSYFQDQLSLNAGQKYCRMLQWEHSAILSTFIKLTFVTKIFVLSIFEGQF